MKTYTLLYSTSMRVPMPVSIYNHSMLPYLSHRVPSVQHNLPYARDTNKDEILLAQEQQ